VTDAGRRTVEALKLDREPLNKLRRRLIRRLRDHQSTVRNLLGDERPEIVDKVTLARMELAEAVRPDAEFSAAAQDFLLGWTPD
jgi:xanthine dehydrogenase iron-sulfur cluster and FAD-binding subunit A